MCTAGFGRYWVAAVKSTLRLGKDRYVVQVLEQVAVLSCHVNQNHTCAFVFLVRR